MNVRFTHKRREEESWLLSQVVQVCRPTGYVSGRMPGRCGHQRPGLFLVCTSATVRFLSNAPKRSSALLRQCNPSIAGGNLVWHLVIVLRAGNYNASPNWCFGEDWVTMIIWIPLVDLEPSDLSL